MHHESRAQFVYRVHDFVWKQWSSNRTRVPCSVWSSILTFEASQPDHEQRLRSTYERFVLRPEIRRNPAIWRSYLDFELVHGSVVKAKRLFYRAINACPHAKALWLVCAQPPMLSVFSRSEVDGLVEVMTEKELRLHVPWILEC